MYGLNVSAHRKILLEIFQGQTSFAGVWVLFFISQAGNFILYGMILLGCLPCTALVYALVQMARLGRAPATALQIPTLVFADSSP